MKPAEITIYREKKYVCGEYLDVYIYPVYKKPGARAKKAQPSTETQRKLNYRHSREELTRKLHANFTQKDIEIGINFRENPESYERVKQLLSNFYDRVRRLREKMGLPPLKYITVIEVGKKSGKYHCHIVMNGGIDRDVLEKLWGLGYANARRLQFTKTGIAGLAHYITKNPIGKKRWSASRNLIDPPPQTNDGRIRSRRRAVELARDTEDQEPWEKLYPGYGLAEVIPFHNDENGGVYLFARLYRKDGKFIAPGRSGKRRKTGESHYRQQTI